jgi:hypothetical protein
MLEAEARELLRKPLEYRRAFLAGVEKKRGKLALLDLQDEMLRQHREKNRR